MPCRQPTEVLAGLGFSDPQGQIERLAQQLGGLLERRHVRGLVVRHRLGLRDHIGHVMQDAVPRDLPLVADAAQIGVVVAGLDGSDGALDTEGPLGPAACRAGGSADLEDTNCAFMCARSPSTSITWSDVVW